MVSVATGCEDIKAKYFLMNMRTITCPEIEKLKKFSMLLVEEKQGQNKKDERYLSRLKTAESEILELEIDRCPAGLFCSKKATRMKSGIRIFLKPDPKVERRH